MFFNAWAALGRVLVVGPLAYAALVLLLRVSGKRTLTKLNAFDLVITMALGSTLADVLLNKSVALAEGVLALAVLIFLQFVVTWSSVRSERVQRLVKAEPTLLLHRGRFLDAAMRAQRVTREDVLAVLRGRGNAELGAVAAVVLETDGSLSVLSSGPDDGPGTLSDVPRVSGKGTGKGPVSVVHETPGGPDR